MTIGAIQPDPERVEELFDAAQKRKRAARTTFLAEACAGDDRLKSRVLALLAADDAAGEFLEAPALCAKSTGDLFAPESLLGTRIGRYRLMQVLGDGGFGVVYLAQQEEPVRRRVALKIIKSGLDTQQVIARFEAERQALAMMEHAGIATILDAGTTNEGRPFFVMELIEGVPITDYCEANNLRLPERLALFLEVCDATQHAHQRGVIHCDLKPGNVLVTLRNGSPVPKVIDFGIARATRQKPPVSIAKSKHRRALGTPEYMSPEQVNGTSVEVDIRTDVYSLGALLYELLAGKPPFDPEALRTATFDELHRIVRQVEPPKLSVEIRAMGKDRTSGTSQTQRRWRVLSREVCGDLDWIVLKALEKSRARRYQTVYELAQDIRRHLHHKPVHAVPSSLTYRIRKFVARNRVALLFAAVVLFGLTIGLLRESRHRRMAVMERDAARLARAEAMEATKRADAAAARSEAVATLLQELLASTEPNEALERDLDAVSVLQRARELFGDDHAAVAAILGSLGIRLQNEGKLNTAEVMLRESLQHWRRTTRTDDDNVAIALYRLGALLRVKGALVEAESALRESLDASRAAQGRRTIIVSDTLLELAEVSLARGDYGKAVAAVAESLDLRRQLAPHQRLAIGNTLNLLVRSLLIAGREEEALPVAEEAMNEWRGILPHRGTAAARLAVDYGMLHLRLGDYAGAEALFTEALTNYLTVEERPVMYIQRALNGMVEVLNHRDDGSQAILSERMDLIALARRIYDSRDPALASALIEQANYLAGREQWRAAITMLLEGLDILQIGESTDRELAAAWSSLQDTVWRVACLPGRDKEDYDIALEADELYAAEFPDSFEALTTMGALHYRLGDYDDALAALAKCEASLAQTQDATLWHGVAVKAMAHHQLGDFEASAAALQRLREAMQQPTIARDLQCQRLLAEAEAVITHSFIDCTRTDN